MDGILTRKWYGNYYRVYPVTAQDEIESLLQNKKQFQEGGIRIFPAQYTPHMRTFQFIVRDGNYLSGRWPGTAIGLPKSWCNCFKM